MEKKNVISPYILKESKEHLTELDIYSELMKNRILFFDQEFNDETCSVAISQLIYLASVSDSPITIVLYFIIFNILTFNPKRFNPVG